MLSKAAFNALLKTLEETPSNIIFILATTEFNKIPQTIVSRCQVLNFKLIPNQEIKTQLASICKSEKVKISNEALEQIAFFGRGSLRDAISNLEKVITYSEDITIDSINEIYNISSKDNLIKLLNAYGNKDSSSIINILNDMKKAGTDFETTAAVLINYILDYTYYQTTKDHKVMSYLSQEDVNKIDIQYELAMDVAKKITELFNKKTDTSYFKILFEIILLEDDELKFNLQTNFNSSKKESQVVTQEITKTKTMEAPEVGIKKTTELKTKEESTIKITKNIIDEVKDNNTSKTMEIKTVIEDTKEIGTDEMTKLIKTAQFDVVEEKPKATSKKDEVEKRDPSFNVDDILNVLVQKDNDITMAVKSK
jgi:DNA polymerase-3 subunit gamma/tau